MSLEGAHVCGVNSRKWVAKLFAQIDPLSVLVARRAQIVLRGSKEGY